MLASSYHSSIRVALGLLVAIGCSRSPSEEPLGPPRPEIALAGLAPDQPISVTLNTDQGPIPCQLDPHRAPHAVSLFVGLATGRAPWRDPRTGGILRRPLYQALPFFRAIPGVLIQSGCPLGNGTGHPGYRIEVEAHADDSSLLRVPGALILARYTPPPLRTDPSPPPPGKVLGSQFAVTLTDMHHLAGQVTVLGTCSELVTARRIAELVSTHRAMPTLLGVQVSGVGEGDAVTGQRTRAAEPSDVPSIQ